MNRWARERFDKHKPGPEEVEAFATSRVLAKRRISDFGCFAEDPQTGKPIDKVKWGLFEFSTNASDVLEQSNQKVIDELLEESPTFSENVIVGINGHWLVGHTEARYVRLLDDSGVPTNEASIVLNVKLRLEEYPALDEDAWGEAEHGAGMSNLESLVREALGIPFGREPKRAFANWVSRVYQWLSDNEPRQLEPRDGNGFYPDLDVVREACRRLCIRFRPFRVRTR